MTESLHQSSDLPDFDTYPASPADQLGLPGMEKSSLEQRAAELGAAAGKVVYMLKQARTTMESLPNPVLDRLHDVAENIKARAEQLGRVAGERAHELKDAARTRTAELGHQVHETTLNLARQARTNYDRARVRASKTVREHPVETALAAGALGFLIGVGLRIRRAKRAY